MTDKIQWEKLLLPFPANQLEFKVEVKSKDGQSGQASTYVDPRRYMERLDDVFGPYGWSVEYRTIGEQGLIARLSIVTSEGHTIVREDVGEYGSGGRGKDAAAGGTGSFAPKSQFPNASAQAFKRACTTLGLGRYFYYLPKMWGKIDGYGQFEKTEIEKFRGIVSQHAPHAKSAPTPQSAPHTTSGNGNAGVQQARAIARIGQLIDESHHANVEIKLPHNWQSLPYAELVTLGQKVAKVVSEAKEQEAAK